MKKVILMALFALVGVAAYIALIVYFILASKKAK